MNNYFICDLEATFFSACPFGVGYEHLSDGHTKLIYVLGYELQVRLSVLEKDKSRVRN